MSERGEPIYKSRRHAPEAARFGRCQRINNFILMSEGSSNTYLVETGEDNSLINSGMGFEAPVHHANYRDLFAALDQLAPEKATAFRFGEGGVPNAPDRAI